MTERLMFVVFGVLIGVISGITLMSLAVISPSLVDKKTLGDVSNVVVAVGAVFTLAFSLWQHQQTLNREKIQSKPKMRLVGAPISMVATLQAAMHAVQVEFQFLNDSKNAAAKLRFRIFMGPRSNPELLVPCRDEVMANPIFGGQGFHWVLKGEFPKSIDPKDIEAFVYLRLDFMDSDADGELLFSEYFLKLNHAEAAIANAMKREVEPFESKIGQLLRA